MNVFGKQLEERKRRDHNEKNRSLRFLAGAISGRNREFDIGISSGQKNIYQVALMLRHLKLQIPEAPRAFTDPADQIDELIETSGATKRHVDLTEEWWKEGDGPLLAVVKGTRDLCALFPGAFGGYYYLDPESGKKIRITNRNHTLFGEAWCIYRPLPGKSMTGKDYLIFLLRQLNRGDVTAILLASLLMSLFGMLTPMATSLAFSSLIPSGKRELLIPLAILLVSAAVGIWLVNMVKVSVTARIESRMDVAAQNAVYARVIRSSTSFFAEGSSGELAQKISALNGVPGLLTQILFGVLLTVLVSLIYVVQVFFIARELAVPVLVVYLAEVLLFAGTVGQERRRIRRMLAASEGHSGILYAMLAGVQKIRLSGSEDRAFSKWLEAYAPKIRYSFAVQFPASFRMPLMVMVQLLGMLWIYATAFENGLSVAQFAAFSSAFGLAFGGIEALASSGSSLSMIQPILERGESVLREVPESRPGRRKVRRLRGQVELNHIVFRYHPDSPVILNDLSISIAPGEYVAIVGRSGCGKSTLMRLLLGFETPEQGSILLDGVDLGSLDIPSLRRQIGTVLQNGQLFAGDLFSNITVCAPHATLEDAWEAARMAGLDEDIRRMPMGMQTFLSDGGGGISGGQRQRLLIARALCGKPRLLLLDEATSALDNLTQKVVADSLAELGCTRIVIAHRLSTIQACNRILVLDQGRVAEEGTYEELMAKDGLFAALARRQQVNYSDTDQ